MSSRQGLHQLHHLGCPCPALSLSFFSPFGIVLGLPPASSTLGETLLVFTFTYPFGPVSESQFSQELGYEADKGMAAAVGQRAQASKSTSALALPGPQF